MADNSSKQDKYENHIKSFFYILCNIKSILSNFKKDTPEVLKNCQSYT